LGAHLEGVRHVSGIVKKGWLKVLMEKSASGSTGVRKPCRPPSIRSSGHHVFLPGVRFHTRKGRYTNAGRAIEARTESTRCSCCRRSKRMNIYVVSRREDCACTMHSDHWCVWRNDWCGGRIALGMLVMHVCAHLCVWNSMVKRIPR
jgi:hypothetical protein